MTRLPSVTPREVMAALLKAGFVERKGRGSHRAFRHPQTRRIVTVSVHSEALKRGTLAAIIRQSGISRDNFLELL